MFTRLETPCLILRSLQPDDWQAVLSYTSDPVVMRYLPEEHPFTPEAAQQFTSDLACPDKFAINLKRTGEFIGHLLFCPHDSAERTREFGWVIHPEYQGYGYATEAASAVLKYGFETLGLHRVVASCDSRNLASQRVMEKLGMRREAHFKQCLFRQGEWIDEYFYAILAEEWRAPERRHA